MQIDTAYPRTKPEDSETSLELTRVASRFAGVPLHTCFLDCEIRECIHQWMVHGHKPSFNNVVNCKRFGLSRSTFRLYRMRLPVLEVAALEGIANETSRMRAARDIADSMSVTHQGRPPNIRPEEVEMQRNMAATLKEAGEGCSTTTARAMARKCLAADAEKLSGGDPVKAALLLQATCSRDWFKKQVEKFGVVEETSVKETPVKETPVKEMPVKETPVKVGGHAISELVE